MKTEEGNKLIAEFMELVENTKPHERSFSLKPGYTPSSFTSFVHDNMPDESWYVYPKFHSSWDWLMPVVDKIENLPTSKIIERPVLYCNRDYNKEIYAAGFKEGFPAMDSDYYGNSVIDKTKILAVWQACVNFINWYNENSNQNEEK